MPQLVNLSVKFHPDTRTERNQMPEMLQVFVNVGAKEPIQSKQNYRTIQMKSWMGLPEGVNMSAEGGCWMWQGGQRVRKQEQNKSAIWNSESSHSGGINGE